MQIYAALPLAEISIYCITWVSGVFFAVYKLWVATDFMNPHRQRGFEVGWSLSAHNDVTDYEWKTWVPFLLYKAPWVVSHFVGAELVRRNNIELLPVWYVLISSIFLLNFVGASVTGLVLLQLSLVFACKFLRSRVLLWVLCMALLLCLNKGVFEDLTGLGHTENYLVVVCCCWSLLRSLSFCLDGLNTPPQHPVAVDFVLYLSYCLYLPVLVLGPVIVHSDFQAGLKQPYKKWTFIRVVCAVCSILRYVFWALVIDVILQFLYFNTLIVMPKKVAALGNWALYGYGYCLGQFFMVKYVVIYGVGTAVAQLEQIDAPRHPKCIARVHLYSYMWRHFDRGLYFFLLKYIYIPCRGNGRGYWSKLFASFACFVFVFIWHTTYLPVFVWTVLNFMGVTLEGLGKQIAAMPNYRKWEDSVLSPCGIRRFHALLSTPIFMMSAVSNFYFLGSYTMGNLFFNRLLNDSFAHNLYLFIFCYCCCQVSIEAGKWEQRRMLTSKQKSQ